MDMRNESVTCKKGLALIALLMAICIAGCLGLPAKAHAAQLTAGDAQLTAQPDQGAQLSLQKKAKASKKAKAQKKAKVYKIRSAKQWRAISTYKGGTFKLMKSIKLPNEKYYLNIKKSKKYVIDLNGHTVKTAYTGVPLRTVAPLHVAGGTVVLKNSKSKGMLYSTETAAVVLQGAGKFYLQNATVVNNATEFRSDITSAIMAYGKSKCYLQGNKTRIQSIGNGVALFEKSRLYVTGNPWVRAGANNYTGQFTHYGSAVVVASRDARASIKGGSYGTKATPDAFVYSVVGSQRYTQSGNYPILDQSGFAIGTMIPKGYKVVDSKGQTLSTYQMGMMDYYDGVNAPSMADLLAGMGYKSPEYYQVFTADVNGYYTVYVRQG